MPRAKRSKSPVGVSPLVTSDARAPTSPVLTTPPPSSPTRETESGRRIHSVKSRSRDSHGPRHQTARSPERPQGNRPQSREVQSPERHQGHSQRSPTDPARAGGVMYSGRSTSPASKVTTPITKAEVLGRSPRFFEHGVGTQVMLSSATSQAMGILLDRARHLLDNTAVEELKEKIEQYEQTKQIGNLVQFLITTLDSPTKLQLLTEIRSILHPLDLPKFDELVSQREVAALHKRASREFKDEEGDSEGETWKMYDVEAMEEQNQDHNDEAADRYTMVLTEIQKHGGQGSLRNSREDASHTSRRPPHDLGAFGNSNAQHMVHKASSDEPSMIGLQTEESFLAWNEEYGDERWLRGTDRGYTPGQPSVNNAVVVELPKSGPNIGLNIHGGVNTPMPEVRIRKVLEGGVAHNDGFLKPGFEIIEVDGIKVRGMTHEQAARTIANAFSSEHPTIEFIVIPQ